MAENFIERDGQEVFKEEFLEFAGYNLQRRAIPDARDGLKWGARQLLYSQFLGGFNYDKPFKKAIKSVSQAMGYCYVHGDASAYGTFIRMAKPFSYRYPLQEANGNYGTLINPDDHSASRYVELRGSKVAAQLLADINKDTINEWEDTYDLEGQFPKVLPSKGFWGGVNGCISIGSGMSCSIPPTNLREVNQALITLLNNPDANDDEIICYPDFPTGATILNKSQVRESMLKGHGNACKIRASVEYDSVSRCFIVKSMPYSTFTNTICNELAAIMENDEKCGISEFVDYTGENPDLRIYLTKQANPEKVLTRLYKDTSLQTHYTINMIMLDHGTTPKLFGWREMLLAHLTHEKEVYRRGFQFDLNKIEKRLHIVDGLLIALASIEEVIQAIKSSSSTSAASLKLQQNFLLDEVQTKAILDMKLSRLAHLEVQKLEKEKSDLEIEATRITAILKDESLLKKEIENGLREVSNKFGDARRTQIMDLAISTEDEIIEEKSLIINLTNYGNIYTNEQSTLITQKRGGAGSKMKLQSGEFVIESFVDSNHGVMMAFSNIGKGYNYLLSDLPVNSFINVSEILKLNDGEKITNIISYNKAAQYKYILFITKNGLVKKTELSEYKNKNGRGSQAIKLHDGDSIARIVFLNDEKIAIATASGQFMMFETKDINPIGKIASGVQGVKLGLNDYVADGRVVKEDTTEFITISSDGMISRTPITEISVTNRNVKGVRIQKINTDASLIGFIPASGEREIVATTGLTAIRFSTKEVQLTAKGSTGVHAIKLKPSEQIKELLEI